MPMPQNLGAYADCFEYFETARISAKGIRLQFHANGEARYFFLRMHQARVLARNESCRLYPSDDPRWNRSDYDGLQVKSPVEDTEGHFWVYVEHHNSRVIAVEDLSGVDPTRFYDLPLLEGPTPIPLLEGPANADEA